MLEINRLYNMDCLEGIRQVKTGSVKAIITDPPYFQGLTQNGQRGDFSDLEITKPFWQQLAKEWNRVLRPDGEFYIFMDWRGYAFYYPIFADFLPVKNLIVWDKGSGPGSFYSYTHEFILYGTKNAALLRGGSNVWREKGYSSGAQGTDGPKLHPAQKSVAIMGRCMADSTEPGDLVVDCFAGSGTCCVAAIRTGRNFIAFENKPSTFEKAISRIELEQREAKEAAASQLTLQGISGGQTGRREAKAWRIKTCGPNWPKQSERRRSRP